MIFFDEVMVRMVVAMRRSGRDRFGDRDGSKGVG
jgi:hypothetical protein